MKTFSSRTARQFLEEIISSVGYPIHTIQTDNGSEFAGEFDKVIQQLQLIHLWSYPRRPKTQAFVERFNGILQEEFLDYEIDSLHQGTAIFDEKLNIWLDFYHQKRTHQGLGYLTPAQALEYQLAILQTTTSCAKCV